MNNLNPTTPGPVWVVVSHGAPLGRVIFRRGAWYFHPAKGLPTEAGFVTLNEAIPERIAAISTEIVPEPEWLARKEQIETEGSFQ